MTQTSHAMAVKPTSARIRSRLTLVTGQNKMLLIEDDYEYRTKLAEFLRQGGLVIDTARSGCEAVLLAQQTRYQSVILDLRLPDMTPGAVHKELIRLREGKFRLFILTAYPFDLDQYEELRDQAVKVIVKDSDEQFFQRLLRELQPPTKENMTATTELDRPYQTRQVSDAIVGIPGFVETLFLLAERQEVTAKDMLTEGIPPEDVFRIIEELRSLNLIGLTPNVTLTIDGRRLMSKLLAVISD